MNVRREVMELQALPQILLMNLFPLFSLRHCEQSGYSTEIVLKKYVVSINFKSIAKSSHISTF